MTLDAPDSEESVAADFVFGVLSDARRRYALYYLREQKSATVTELATVLASWLGTREDETAIVAPDDLELVRTALYHSHVPRLADAGLVSYDSESDEVTIESLPELLEVALDLSLDQQCQTSARGPPSEFDRRARE